MKPITLELFKQYKGLNSVKFSPDGKKAVFCLNTVDEANDGYNNTIYLYADGKVKALTSLGKEGAPIWDDNDTLLFSTIRSANDQKQAASGKDYSAFYRLSLYGGEAYEAFSLPINATDIQKVENGLYLIMANIDADYPDFYKLSDEEKDKIIAEKKANEGFHVLTEAPYWTNGVIPFTSKRRNRLFLFKEADKSLEPITPALFQCDCFTLIDKKVFIVGKEYSLRATNYKDVYRYDLETMEGRLLFENNQFGSGHQTVDKLNNQLVYMAATTETYGMDAHCWFYIMDQETGEVSLGCPSDHNFYLTKPGTDGVYQLTYERKNNCIYCFNGTSNECTYSFDGAMQEFDIFEDQILFVGTTNYQLSELYSYNLSNKELTQITHFNTAVLEDKYVGTCEPLTISSHDWDVDGYIIKPMDFDPNKKYPGILSIHGGPKGSYNPVFNHTFQQLAAEGYFVFYCNPKGSDGRGNEFAEIRGQHGHADYEDIMNFTDAVLAKYPQIDPERLGVVGHSYGGYMTNWIIGHTNRFKVATSLCGIASWVSLYALSDISMVFVPDQMNGPLSTHFDTYWDNSPLKYAHNCTTPTLFLLGTNDYRCPVTEGLMMATVLMDHNCETRVVTFDGVNHSINWRSKPSQRQRSFKEMTDWLNGHLK